MERQDEVGARAHEGGHDAAHEERHHRPPARTRVDGVIGVWKRLMADPIMGWAFAPRGSANSD